VHLQYPLADMASTAQQGYCGGMIGFALAWVMASYVGYWGGMLILIGLLIVSLIFLFNTTLAQMVEIHKKLFRTKINKLIIFVKTLFVRLCPMK